METMELKNNNKPVGSFQVSDLGIGITTIRGTYLIYYLSEYQDSENYFHSIGVTMAGSRGTHGPNS
jgi:hypothetical protein